VIDATGRVKSLVNQLALYGIPRDASARAPPPASSETPSLLSSMRIIRRFYTGARPAQSFSQPCPRIRSSCPRQLFGIKWMRRYTLDKGIQSQFLSALIPQQTLLQQVGVLARCLGTTQAQELGRGGPSSRIGLYSAHLSGDL
jgi:hypothetical protein